MHIYTLFYVGEKMKTELKLTLNNLKSNKKRTLFTIISIMLCSILIFTTTILVSSIKNGIIEISEQDESQLTRRYNIWQKIIMKLC